MLSQALFPAWVRCYTHMSGLQVELRVLHRHEWQVQVPGPLPCRGAWSSALTQQGTRPMFTEHLLCVRQHSASCEGRQNMANMLNPAKGGAAGESQF